MTKVGPSEAEVLLIRAPESEFRTQVAGPVAEIIVLEYADATELAETLRLFIEDATGARGPASPGPDTTRAGVTIVADGTTNSLLLRASEERLGELKELIARLDVDANGNG